VLFDAAYQGFASGDPARDRLPMQLFANDGHEPVICQSFAKNFGMYGERVGSFTVLTDSAETSEKVCFFFACFVVSHRFVSFKGRFATEDPGSSHVFESSRVWSQGAVQGVGARGQAHG
jgi:histidinol-phosphate/aromatic aminotransferase/cobyric acid decarboxylase-like protein